MSTVSATGNAGSSASSASYSSFEDQLTSTQSSKILADYVKDHGGAVWKSDLQKLADNASGDTPSEVSAAASYMLSHPDVYTTIETLDNPNADGLSGHWNFSDAANGALGSTGAIADLKDVFDRAIESSAEITKLTTEKKTGLDATKQRPQN
ncbi:hypothetical protein [Salinicola rhizosphaerae]|uniref:Uncharacterized protein n=1 Tax=Salinicola rhizosphaerae TaxID=1443141 RepID=A0ABQ3E0V8_9GAMM|nr:hypothetical protein [Salinicola rhizosphaerae]GHB21421.1 hypothetical protein GCM10009038_20340 [Salinicola rhizosphaerae]